MRRVAWAALIVAISGVSWLAGMKVLRVPRQPPNRKVLQDGTEVLFVLIGSRYCAAAQDTAYQRLVRAAIARVASDASRHNSRFAQIGVAIDWATEDGLSFLEPFGPFDELVLGRGWVSTGVDRFVRGYDLPQGIPEIVILVRDIHVAGNEVNTSGERVLAVLNGIGETRTWMEEGAKLRWERRDTASKGKREPALRSKGEVR